jgi:hypothetical protein
MKARCAWACGIAFAMLSATANAEVLGQATPLPLPLLRLGIGFVICALLALAAAFALRRFGLAGASAAQRSWFKGSGKIIVAETRRMSLQADICRVICGDREYLVIVSTAGATVLRETELPPPEQTS